MTGSSLEVWTNSALKTRWTQQVWLCKNLEAEHLMLFIDLTDHVNDVEIMVEKGKEEQEKRKVLENEPIEELDLSVTFEQLCANVQRNKNCLERI